MKKVRTEANATSYGIIFMDPAGKTYKKWNQGRRN